MVQTLFKYHYSLFFLTYNVIEIFLIYSLLSSSNYIQHQFKAQKSYTECTQRQVGVTSWLFIYRDICTKEMILEMLGCSPCLQLNVDSLKNSLKCCHIYEGPLPKQKSWDSASIYCLSTKLFVLVFYLFSFFGMSISSHLLIP